MKLLMLKIACFQWELTFYIILQQETSEKPCQERSETKMGRSSLVREKSGRDGGERLAYL